MMRRLIQILTILCLAAACSNKGNDPQWVDTGKAVNPNYADVFWISGVLFTEDTDSDGEPIYRIGMDERQKEVFRNSVVNLRDNIFPDSLNFFAPYYHQFTLKSVNLPEEQFDSLYNAVADEIYEAFQFYIKNLNKGRPYVLAGASEGGMLACALLKRMTDEEHANFVAAYSIGFGLSLSDMIYRFVKPAKGEFDKGVVVSYNSVQSVNDIKPFVHNRAYAVINPLTWKTDGTTGHTVYEGDSLAVRIDPRNKVLIVKGLTRRELEPSDELGLYAESLRRNVLDRVYR